MELKQVSDNCLAVLNKKNRVCDANSGLIKLGGGVVIDPQADLGHARQIIELFSTAWPAMPRHVINGPLCGVEGVTELKAYPEYVRNESRKCFDDGLSSLEDAETIEFGPYGEWRAPARLYMNVERAYREFRDEPPDAPWDTAATFDAIYKGGDGEAGRGRI